MDLKWTIVLLGFGIVGLFILTAWVEALQRWLFKIFHLDQSSALAWFTLALFSTLIFLFVLHGLGIELHDLIGISETVDEELTNQKEVFRRGHLVHISLSRKPPERKT